VIRREGGRGDRDL